MTDQLERYLKTEFEDDAARAPQLASLSGGQLARNVQDGVRRARRRRYAVAAAGLAAVIAVPLVSLVMPELTHEGSPTANRPGAETNGVLSYRGVELTVPQSMLSESNRRCGKSVRDAAFIEDRYSNRDLCAVAVPNRRTLTEVSLYPGGSTSVDTPAGTVVLADGRTRILSYVRERGLAVKVASPDPRRAQKIMDSLRILPLDTLVDGCSLFDPGPGPASWPSTSGPIAPPDADAGAVCGYNFGWLADSRTLTAEQARELSATFAAAPNALPSRTGKDCPLEDAWEDHEGHWDLTLGHGGDRTRIWVYPSRCGLPAGVNESGATVELTQELGIALAGLANGAAEWTPAAEQVPTTTSDVPRVTPAAADGVLSFRGVQVPVPKQMLDPARRDLCRSSRVGDAAWWSRPGRYVRFTGSCEPFVDQTPLTEVVLRGLVGGEPRIGNGAVTLEDGRVQVRRSFEDRGLVLVVTSPDAARAQRIADSATAIAPEGQLDGCRVKDLGDQLRAKYSSRSGPIVPERALSGRVCGYDEGWLVESAALDRAEAQNLTDELLASPDVVRRNWPYCKGSPTFDGHGSWRVQLTSASLNVFTVEITPRACVSGPSGVTQDGRSFELTDSLAKTLDGFAAGPTDW